MNCECIGQLRFKSRKSETKDRNKKVAQKNKGADKKKNVKEKSLLSAACKSYKVLSSERSSHTHLQRQTTHIGISSFQLYLYILKCSVGRFLRACDNKGRQDERSRPRRLSPSQLYFPIQIHRTHRGWLFFRRTLSRPD